MIVPAKGQARVRRYLAVVLAGAVVAGVAASCTPGASAGPTPQQEFCAFWNAASESPPTESNAVVVKEDVVALAQSTIVRGSQCTDPAAKVSLAGATLAQGEEVPSQQGGGSTATIAAVTGDGISAGEPLLDNLWVQTLSADIGANGITVRGNVNVRLSGAVSTIGFVGTLSDLENWSVSLSSAGFIIPGITTSPVVFSGLLKVTNGVPSLSLTALASSVKIGDILVTGARVMVDASPATGLSASVGGTVEIGPSTATGNVDVSFDKAGNLVSATADLSAHLDGTRADGTGIDLNGNVHFEGNATETLITFSGSGNVGELVVNEANGSIALESNQATFTGKLDVQAGSAYVRYDGVIVWDGIAAYAPLLQLEGGGSYSGTLADGSIVNASGSVTVTIVGGQVRTEVTGLFTIGSLKLDGMAVVDTNGTSTNLTIEGNLVAAGFAAHVTGVVTITDGVAELVTLDAVVDGEVRLGDLTVTGANLHVGSTYGGPLDFSFSGGLQIGARASLNGSVKAQIGPDGTLLSLVGDVSGSMSLDGWNLAFDGALVAGGDQATLQGSVNLQLRCNFPLGLTISGAFTSSLSTPNWSLTGSAAVRFGSVNVTRARLSLSQGAGLKATRMGFYFQILGISTYFEGDFNFQPSGGTTSFQITGGNWLLKPIVEASLPQNIGC